MHTNPTIPAMKSLKLYGTAHALSDLSEQDSPAFQAGTGILDHLLKAELAEHEVRSVAYQLKTAKFPAYRDLSGFDFASSMANKALIRQLCAGDFMDSAQNVVLVGRPTQRRLQTALMMKRPFLIPNRTILVETFQSELASDQVKDSRLSPPINITVNKSHPQPHPTQ